MFRNLPKVPTISSSAIIGGVAFLALLFFIGYVVYKKSKKVVLPTPQGAPSEAIIILFSVDWCPHCKTAKPEWEQAKQELNGKVINGYTVVFNEVDCTSESAEVEKQIEQYKITGYPTIKLLKDGQVIEYDAKPTKATIINFLNTVL